MRLDLTSLRLFVSIAEEGSIASASLREHLVPSAVSKRLALLEARLGTELVMRHTKGIGLTPAGEALLLRARDILRSVDATELEISEFTSNGYAHLRLTANHSAMAHTLPGDLASYLNEYPRAKLDVVERLSADVLRAVSEGAADVGIFCWPAVPHGLHAFSYRNDVLVLATPVGHPLSRKKTVAFEEVSSHQYITYLPNLFVSAAIPEFHNHAISRVRVHVANFEATCRMVEEGIGVAVLPLANVQAYERQGRLACIRLSDEWAHRKLQICIRTEMLSRPSLMAFVKHLASRADI